MIDVYGKRELFAAIQAASGSLDETIRLVRKDGFTLYRVKAKHPLSWADVGHVSQRCRTTLRNLARTDKRIFE